MTSRGEVNEAHEAHRVENSGFFKVLPARPTADDVEYGDAANVPFDQLPDSTQATLKRRKDARIAFGDADSKFPHEGMFAGEGDKVWGKSPEHKTERPTL